MTELTVGLSPQGLHTYQQAFQFYLTWGGDPAAAHQQALLLARDGDGPDGVGSDVFAPAAPSRATPAGAVPAGHTS